MKIAAPKYMRDFYPEDMRFRLAIEDAWRQASLRAGFHEWDSPILEQLELYKRKSGDEIVGQLFSLTTKGGDELAIRPEMTPSLARMIAQRQSALPRPIKWFCISRMCRFERGQRGRLREFWQWNCDVLGVSGSVADAEVISVALDALIALGLMPEDIEVRINSRSLISSLLTAVGLPAERHAAVYAIVDKRGKIQPAEVDRLYDALELGPTVLDRLRRLLRCETLDEVATFARVEKLSGHELPLGDLQSMFQMLDALGKSRFCRFDISIVRGLAYYTGPVFEIFDKRVDLRAICGGGRYDRLLESMGGQPMPACGFGMGDVVLGELLREVNKIPGGAGELDAYVIPLDDERLADALKVVQALRHKGERVDYAVKAGGLGKTMKRASEMGAKKVLLVGGAEWAAGRVRVKNMTDGTERDVPIETLFASP